MKIQGTEHTYTSKIEQTKITRSFEEMKANTPKQDDAASVMISKEGIASDRRVVILKSKTQK